MKTVITAEDKGSININELKNYTGLLKYLSLRDVTVRYKQSVLGVAWSIIRPAVNILIFGSLAVILNPDKSKADNFLIVSACVIFWQLLSTLISDVSGSLMANSNILTKVYFPKILLPLSSMFVAFVDFLISFIIFLLMFFYLKGLPPTSFLVLPIVLLYGIFFSFSIGLLFSASSVKYRDVRFALPFFVQILFYATPVFISSSKFLEYNIPYFLKVIYQLNPFVYIINLFKYCFTGTLDAYNTNYFVISIIVAILLFIISLKVFIKNEKSFADYI